MHRSEALKAIAALLASAGAPSGGTASATQQVRQSGQIDVRDYGARGDGVTDDALAIQAAIAASEVAGQAAVTFPPGTYRCTKGLKVAADRTSLVAPAGATLDFSTLNSGIAL